jgi:hypothetical protein
MDDVVHHLEQLEDEDKEKNQEKNNQQDEQHVMHTFLSSM